jgi:hypothetical protein
MTRMFIPVGIIAFIKVFFASFFQFLVWSNNLFLSMNLIVFQFMKGLVYTRFQFMKGLVYTRFTVVFK